MDKYITVEYLYDIFGRLIDKGYGDMRICLESLEDQVFIRKDEIGFDYYNRHVNIRSNYPSRDTNLQATQKLNDGIEKLIQKYYREVK